MQKIAFVPIKTFREELLAVKLWFGLTCVLLSTTKCCFSFERSGCHHGWKKSIKCSVERINRFILQSRGGEKNQHRWKPRTVLQPHICWNLISDELCCVSFADEDFQQSQFGFDVLVLAVLCRQWGAVLLLHVSMGTRQQMVRQVER